MDTHVKRISTSEAHRLIAASVISWVFHLLPLFRTVSCHTADSLRIHPLFNLLRLNSIALLVLLDVLDSMLFVLEAIETARVLLSATSQLVSRHIMSKHLHCLTLAYLIYSLAFKRS